MKGVSSVSDRRVLFLCAVLACAGFSWRYDSSMRDVAREQAQRLAHRLAEEAGPAALGYERPDLSWLHLYPEVQAAELTDSEGRSVVSYRSPDENVSGGLYSSRKVVDGGWQSTVQVDLPPWTSSTRELPLLALCLLLSSLAWPAKTERKGLSLQQKPLASEPPDSAKPKLVLELDSDLRISRASRGVDVYGYSPQELVGSPVSSLLERFHPNHPSTLLGVSHRNGGRVDSLISSSPVHNPEGKVERVVVTLEEASSETTGDLRARYGRLQRLMDAVCEHAREAVLFLDRSCSLVYCNRSFEDLSGGSEDLLSLLRPADRLRFVDALQETLEGREAEDLQLDLEIGGKAFSLEGSLHAFQSPDNGQRLAVGIFRDVTEARRLAEELRVSRERSSHSQKIEALGRLAGGVAHDFNNLLTTMMLNLEEINLSSWPLHPAHHRSIEEIRIAAQKAAGITGQLLLYSRKKACEPRVVSANSVVDETCRITKGMRGQVTLTTRLGATVDRIRLEDGQLDQILLNLIVNARDALGDQAGQIEVVTENRTLQSGNVQHLPAGSYFVVAVTDNGCGVPPEIQQKIFEPYFTTKEVGRGTGLGLSTVAAAVEKAGGHLSLSSRPGRTAFEILLPVAASDENRDTTHSPVRAIPGSQRSVLLVEDEASIRALVHRLLERQGYKVTSVSNGGAAKDLISGGQNFDLLVTDLRLPGVSGAEVASAYQVSRPRGPVLFMSGFPADTLSGQHLPEKSGFLAKPFSPEQLYCSVLDLLQEAS